MEAIIFNPTKTAMQSGVGKTKKWCLKFNRADDRFIDPVMGWTGATDMQSSQVTLHFNSKEEAIEYAKKHNIEYQVLEPNSKKRIIKNYADNFKATNPDQ